MLKKLIAVAIAGVALIACSDKVDRDGTSDNIVETFESQGFTVDKDCVDDALDQYSDDELKEIDDQLNNAEENEDAEPSAEALALLEQLFTCASLGS